MADVLHHLDEPEGADVGAGDVENVLGSSGADEFLHHLAAEVARVLDLAVELAVAEGAGAAFAELHVALGRELLAAPQSPGVLRALAHGPAAFEHDGAQAHLGQAQRGEHAAGAEAHHHRPVLQRGRRRHGHVPRHVGSGLHVRMRGKAGQHRGLVLGAVGREGHVEDVDLLQVLLACVEAALVHLHGGKGRGRQREHGSGSVAERGVVRVEGKTDFGESDHGNAARVDRAGQSK